MDSGNIGFVMICAALVFFMTPGLSCFYGGLVRRKNAVNTMFTSVVDCDGNRDVDAVRLLAFVRTGSRRCDR